MTKHLKKLINENALAWMIGLFMGALMGITIFALMIHLIVKPECFL